MRRIPLSTWVLAGLLAGLVVTLGLYACHQHIENRNPIRREINSLIATLQNPLEIMNAPTDPGVRRHRPLWPAAVLAGLGLAAGLLRRREQAQIRSRSSRS